ncbi:MAG: glycosyltransferase family 39 protein [Clostridia bacterium]|nr:glycosyltransferase family 39 protein [Clostridia bacterium]
MALTLLISAVYLILLFVGLGCLRAQNKALTELPKKEWRYILIFSLFFRLALGMLTEGLHTDMGCWRGWADRAANVGIGSFYSDEVFCDYPPGYIYFLYFIGVVRKIFSGMPTGFDTLLLKLPAILCDSIMCGVLYKKTFKETKDNRLPVLLTVLYATNPAIWVNSSVWGQVDAVYTLFLILSLLSLLEESYLRSAILWAVAVVIKPQALLVFPLYLLTIWEKRKIENFWKQLFLSLIGFLLTALLLVLPFAAGKSPVFIPALYLKTLASYPYASVNAFNLSTLLGANWVPINNLFAGLSYVAWGTLGIIAAIGISSFIFVKGKDRSRYFYAAGLLIFGVFVLGSKMHERYLFPAIILFFLAYMQRNDKRILVSAGLVSLLHFTNVIYVYIQHQQGVYHIMAPDATASIVSLLTVILYLYMVYLALSLYTALPSPAFLREEKTGRFTKRDFIIVATVTIAYTVLAFFNLGNAFAPQTPAGADNIADFGTSVPVSAATVYKGIGDCTIYFEFSDDGISWSKPFSFEGSDCFKWTRYSLMQHGETPVGRYARVRFSGGEGNVYEAAFFDETGTQLPLTSDSFLFDEQSYAQAEQTYLNSTYFDEIYHARTAFEHIENIPNHYENTHPPLGKHIIGIGIRLFGMNPFGWRFMGTLCGVLMLPLMYVLGKKIFKSTFFASCAMLLMTFDFMHLAQTRISTIDSYPVFFILLMYLFMYLFFEKAETLSFKKTCMYLALSGVCFGLAIASKWIGFYGGAGLAILFFTALYRRIKALGRRELWLCALCVIFFILVPFLIYYASYFPIHVADGAESRWTNFWRYQRHMFDYHSDLKADHPFSSKWFTWPLVIRPIWYYGNKALSGTGQVSSIVSMGNPAIWWVSFIAIIGCICLAVLHIHRKDKESRPFFLSIGYLSQLAPWILVSRVVFIYHYFASLPFAMLALVYGFKLLCEKYVWGKRAVCIFLGVSAILFLAFYPVLSGTEIPLGYMLSGLRWFDSWVLGYQ